MGKTKDILNIDLVSVWQGLNWKAADLDGHDYNQIEASFTEDFDFHIPFVNRIGWSADIDPQSNYVLDVKYKPLVIIANTIKGKGVSFMEDKLEYHYRHVDDEDYKKAKEELENA